MATYTKTITIRCTEKQLQTWTKKAKEFDMSFNQFIRLAANTLVYTEKPILRRYVYGDCGCIENPQNNSVQ